MNNPVQPSFDRLATHLRDAAYQVSLIPNIPAVEQGQNLTDQLREMAGQLREMANTIAVLNQTRKTKHDEKRVHKNLSILEF